jgi:2-succinyl-5-enolpyruvyl-6-hydroxy-3-cyclohexene-1-carboxylate synthase
VSSCCDIETIADIPSEERFERKPLQLNVCFDEPVLTGDRAVWLSLINEKLSPLLTGACEVHPARHPPGIVGQPSVVEEFLKQCERPLVIVGALCPPDAPVVAQFLSCLGAPVWAEASSQLLSLPELKPLLLRSGNGFVRKLFDQGRFDGVLRIGGVPSPRVWRDLDERLSHLPVCVISEQPFLGLERGELVAGPLPLILSPLLETGSVPSYTVAHDIRAADDVRRAGIAELLGRYPKSEVGMLARIAAHVPARAQVYLGNSLPIREWEIATVSGGPERALYGVSRGANGIDGQLSTFLGWVNSNRKPEPASEAWAIVGDLTALYDLNAFWALRHLEYPLSLRVVVLNNGGGQIFSRMFSSQLFLNQHTISFKGLSEMWGLECLEWSGEHALPVASSDAPGPNLLLIEARPCDTQSAHFWKEFERLQASA